MPLYSYKCAICGSERSDMRTVAERRDGPVCCTWPMVLLIGAVPGFVRNPAVPRRAK